MKWQTFEEWKAEGFYVRKGEKSVLKQPDGVSLFNEEQVEEDDFADISYDEIFE